MSRLFTIHSLAHRTCINRGKTTSHSPTTTPRFHPEENNMAASTVIVSHRDGSPARGVRVVLGFCGGQTRPVYTDHYGRAVVEHTSAGRATIYVRGQSRGSFHAPGTAAAVIA
jgi:hypothetical protein